MSSSGSLNSIPAKYHSIFSCIKHFNHVQSLVLNDVIKTSKLTVDFGAINEFNWKILMIILIDGSVHFSEKHIVVSAPTGSGKTQIMELAIVELLMSHELSHTATENVKIIYGINNSNIEIAMQQHVYCWRVGDFFYFFFFGFSCTDKGAVQRDFQNVAKEIYGISVECGFGNRRFRSK